MYKYIANQIKRSGVYNAAFCLLLALAGALLAIGAALLLSAIGSARRIDAQFTTIALPDAEAILRFATNQTDGQELQEFEMDGEIVRRDDYAIWGEWGGVHFDRRVAFYMQDRTLTNIETVVYRSGAVNMDTRRYFGAYSPDIIALRNTREIFTSGNAGGSAAFIARVTGISEAYSIWADTDEYTGEQHFVLRVYAYVDFEVERFISQHPDTSEREHFFIRMRMKDADGGYFFTEGGRYFVSGEYTVQAIRADRTGLFPTIRAEFLPVDTEELVVKTYASLYDVDGQMWENMLRELPDIVAAPTEQDFPMDVMAARAIYDMQSTHIFALGDMSFEEALQSEMGEAVEYALRAVEMDVHRLNILTTGNLFSKFPFNQQHANITEGRSFTREEYERGAQVAVIPSALAQQNNLEIGDTVSLTFFEGQLRGGALIMIMNGGERNVRIWRPGSFRKGMYESEPMEFEIIGIYTAPNPRIETPHDIPVNTIFIPDNAFAGFYADDEAFQWQDDRAESPMLNVIIVPNGRNEEFRESINALIPGYGNFFRLYDQGYSVVRGALDNLLRNGWFIFVLCLAGWLIAVIVFCLFFVLRKKKESGLLYALGICEKSRFRWVFAQCAVVILAASVIAFTAAAVLYGRIHDYAVDAAFDAAPDAPTAFGDAAVAADGVEQPYEFSRNLAAVPLAVVASVAILLLAAAGMARGMAKGNPNALRGAG